MSRALVDLLLRIVLVLAWVLGAAALPACADRFFALHAFLLPSNTTTEYFPVFGARAVAGNPNEIQVTCPMPDAGKIIEISANRRAAIGGFGGATHAFAIFKTTPPAAGSTTSMAVTFTTADGAGVPKHSTVAPVAFLQGDQLSIQSVPSGSVASSRVDLYVLFDAVTAGASYYCATNNTIIVNQPDTSSFAGSNAAPGAYCSGQIADCGLVVPFTAHARKLIGLAVPAPGAGESCTFIFRDFGSDTGLSCVADSTNGGRCSCVVGSTDAACVATDIAITKDDPVDLNTSCTAGAIAAGIRPIAAFELKAAVPGRFVVPFSPKSQTVSNTAVQYATPYSAAAVFAASEANQRGLAPAFQVTSMSCYGNGAPGAGKNYQYSLRDDGTDAGPVCTISGTNFKCTGVTTASVAVDSLLATKSTPSGTPANVRAACSYAAQLPADAYAVTGDQ